MAWACTHRSDQVGGQRCVRCCIGRPQHHELLAPAGGTPMRLRWLCGPCRAVYAHLGLLVYPERQPVMQIHPDRSGYCTRADHNRCLTTNCQCACHQQDRGAAA